MRRINRRRRRAGGARRGRGPAVLLLHGFPDSAQLWRHQIPTLRDAGFRVVAPDLRGLRRVRQAGRGRAPTASAAASRDLVAVLDALEIEQAHVVGHDWGAGVAWALALMAPERRRPARRRSRSATRPRCARARSPSARSPGTCCSSSSRRPRRSCAATTGRCCASGSATHPDLDALERFDLARAAALNWYRANLHPRARARAAAPLPPVAAPTRSGSGATATPSCSRTAMTGSGEFVDGRWRYERIEGASHWMQLDAAGARQRAAA